MTDNRHYRVVAGNLYLFLGSYFVAVGFLAVLFFTRIHRPNAVLLSAAGILIGWLFVWRAARLLAWRRWIFWFVILLMIVVPIGWLTPKLMSLDDLGLVPFLH